MADNDILPHDMWLYDANQMLSAADKYYRMLKNTFLSHNNPCFQSNIAITNFLVLHTCQIRFNDVIGRCTAPMYSYAKIPNHG